MTYEAMTALGLLAAPVQEPFDLQPPAIGLSDFGAIQPC
jgi:hypothetical protein